MIATDPFPMSATRLAASEAPRILYCACQEADEGFTRAEIDRMYVQGLLSARAYFERLQIGAIAEVIAFDDTLVRNAVMAVAVNAIRAERAVIREARLHRRGARRLARVMAAASLNLI